MIRDALDMLGMDTAETFELSLLLLLLVSFSSFAVAFLAPI